VDKTKNDLSYNEAKLDYQAMLSTSKSAYVHCLEEISRHLHNMRQLHPPYQPYLSAQWLAREAGQLVTIAETMSTLEGGLTRDSVLIVNK
jgi:hypothetical protein